ncbi:MAG: NADPH-dependent FMN reductase [Leadbetterella sp.]
MKICVVIGTNRKDSFTSKIARYYQSRIESLNHSVEVLDISKLPEDFAFSALYGAKNEEFSKFQSMIDQNDKFVFVIPEYNSSYPGALKTFIDGLRYGSGLNDKKACLVGLSAGVLGNAIGLSHFNDVLSYLNMHVLGLRVKLGEVSKHFLDGKFTNPVYEGFVEKQIQQFLEF